MGTATVNYTALDRQHLTDNQAAGLERVFKALADRNRLRMLNVLLTAEDLDVCVCDIEAALGLPQPLVSYHLKQLASAGLVTRERRGTFSYFAIAPGALAQVASLLSVD